MKKRILSLLLVFIMLLGTLPVSAMADEGTQEPVTPPPTTVTVDFTAQAEGAFLCAPQFGVEVSSGLAESYGYTDQVTDGVSALDVLVKAHEVVFGEGKVCVNDIGIIEAYCYTVGTTEAGKLFNS